VRSLILITVLFFLVNTGLIAHPVHVSVCNLELKDKESVIAVKLFSDDFGTVLKNNYHEDIVLSEADKYPLRDFISDYVSSNLRILSNGRKPVKFIYDYSEYDDTNIWLYFRMRKPVSLKKLRIINTLMLDLYDDQTNLLIVNNEGKQEGFSFNIHTTEADINLR